MKGLTHALGLACLVCTQIGCGFLKQEGGIGDEAIKGHAAASLAEFTSREPDIQSAVDPEAAKKVSFISVAPDIQAVIDCPDGVCKPDRIKPEVDPEPVVPKPEFRKPVRKFLKWLIRGNPS